MNKNLLVIFACLALVYSGCQKSDLSLPAPLTADSYFPQTNGSTWTYRDSVYSETTDTAAGIFGIKINNLVFTMNGDSINFNGKLCYNASISAVQNGPGPGIAYFYSFKHLYTLFESNTPFGLTGFDVLTDTASVGYTWTSFPTFNKMLNGSPAKTINQVVEKNISRVIAGKTFTNVIHTSVNFQVNVNNAGFHNIALYEFYLAKGVGLIEKDTYVYGSYNETQTISDYNIK